MRRVQDCRECRSALRWVQRESLRWPSRATSLGLGTIWTLPNFPSTQRAFDRHQDQGRRLLGRPQTAGGWKFHLRVGAEQLPRYLERSSRGREGNTEER